MHSPKRAASPTPSPPSISPTKSAKSSIQLVRTLSNPILSFLNPWNSDEVLPSSSHPAGPNSPPVSGKYRRKSATLARLARLRLVQISLAASIPILGLLLLFELSVHRTRTGQWLEHSQALDGWRKGAGGLGGWREGLVKRHIEMSGVSPSKRAKRATETSKDADLLRKIQDHADEAWPIWWGSSDHAKSPFDYVPPPLVGEKKRILFLTDYRDYLERMNTHTYEIVDAALRHPHVTVDVWGPGWAGYDRSVPLSENVRRRAWRIAQLEESKAEHSRRKEGWWEYEMGKYKRKMRGQRDGGDAGKGQGVASGHLEKPREWVKPGWVLKRVLTPGPAAAVTADEGGAMAISRERSEEGNEGCHPTVQFDVAWTISDIYKQNDPHVDALGCNALLVQQVGDCHSSRCLKEWYPYANNITLSKYAFELQELFNYPDMKERFPGFEMGIFGHSPDTGNEWDFYPIPWKDRTRDAVSSGFDGSFYPIRSTVNSHISSLPSIASLLEQQEKDRLDAEAAEQQRAQDEAEAKARAETEAEVKAETETGTVGPIAGSVVDNAPGPSVTEAADIDAVPLPSSPTDSEVTSDIDPEGKAGTEAAPSPEIGTARDEDPVTSTNSGTTTDTPSRKRKRDIPPDVQTKESFVIQRHAHPGYTISIPSEALDTPLETYENGHAYYTTHEKIREDFANGMRTSRICVFDSSVERKMIRKYAQALLSGCVVAADLPTEHEEHLGNFVIRLEQHWGIDEIEAQIKRYLAQPELLERMALEGFAYARSHLTTTKKISDVLAMAAAHRSGERGYMYEHNFASRCRAYWASNEAYRPPWCSGIAGKESKLT